MTLFYDGQVTTRTPKGERSSGQFSLPDLNHISLAISAISVPASPGVGAALVTPVGPPTPDVYEYSLSPSTLILTANGVKSVYRRIGNSR